MLKKLTTGRIRLNMKEKEKKVAPEGLKGYHIL